MASVGYQYLCEAFALARVQPTVPARVSPVSRVTRTSDALLVPAKVAPASDDVLAHLLFALKHEGTQLQVLAHVLVHLSAAELVAAVEAKPSSGYLRILGFLWEAFNKQQLAIGVSIAGPVAEVFDSSRYITAPGQRNSRWRVNFNGLGSLEYCVTVERNARLKSLLQQDTLSQVSEFLSGFSKHTTDRVLSWAYLHETQSSFAIEREQPSEKKAQAFVALLSQAHQARELSEDYLVELQNAVLSNPYDMAAAFRHEQNWLRGPLRGAAGVTYVPPPPELAAELMQQLMQLGNTLPQQVNPVVAAAILSFGFVFIHPFMDGNGRLSRFLFHYALCQSRHLDDGLLLPVSVAMKRNESEYLQALQSFSVPMRQQWDVHWIADEEYHFDFIGSDTMYRYWDATACVEFGLAMAQQALDKDLREETHYLEHFDMVYKYIDERFDVRGSDLTTLVVSCLQNNGKVSKHRRKQFGNRVDTPVFEAIELISAEVLD